MATRLNLKAQSSSYMELAGSNRNAPSGLTYATMALVYEQRRTADALEQIMAYMYVSDLDFSIQKGTEKAKEEQEMK